MLTLAVLAGALAGHSGCQIALYAAAVAWWAWTDLGPT